MIGKSSVSTPRKQIDEVSQPVEPDSLSSDSFEAFAKEQTEMFGSSIVADAVGQAIGYRFLASVLLICGRLCKVISEPDRASWSSLLAVLWKTALAHELAVVPPAGWNGFKFLKHSTIEAKLIQAFCKKLQVSEKALGKAGLMRITFNQTNAFALH